MARTHKVIAAIAALGLVTGISIADASGVVGNLPAAKAAIEISRKTDLLSKKYGVFVHYVAGLTTDSSGVVINDADDLADAFDVEGFADDLEDFGVEYVKLTAWHADQKPLYPSAVQTVWRGAGTSSTRDLIGEIIDAVKARGIAVILYTHPRVGHSFSNADMTATGWGSGSTYLNPNPDFGTFDYAKWNDFVQQSYDELLDRYGSEIDGIYIDEGDASGQSQIVVDYEALKTMIDAYPNITTLHNYFGSIYSAQIADQERSGPIEFSAASPGSWPAAADTVMSPLIAPTWWATVPSSTQTATRSGEDLFRYTVLEASANRVGLGTSWSAGVYAGGGWESGIAQEFQDLNAYLTPVAKSVKNTFPSRSYPTASGATLNSLSWGVATRSPDDLTTYLHVLTPPGGGTLTLPAPADGKVFRSARMLADGTPVSFTQNSSGVTLTLPSGKSWSSIDTVFALTTSTLSVGAAASASSSVENSEWGVAKAIDGGLTSVSGSRGWTSSSNLTASHTESITIDLGSTKSITDVSLAPRSDPADLGQGFPVDFTVATSTDGVNFTTRTTVNDLPMPTTTQVYSFERVSARYVRVQGTELRANPNDSNQYRMVFAEVAVRDRPPTGSALVLTNAHHHRNLQGTAAPYQSSSTVHDVVITPSPKRNPEVYWTIAHVSGDYYTLTNDYRANWRLTGTGDNYPGRTDVNWVVQSSAEVSDAQLWQLVPAGDGSYQFINKAYNMQLHGAGARYPGLVDIYSVVMVPRSWNSDEQRWFIGQ